MRTADALNICLLGDFSEQLDEGYKNASHHLAGGLDRIHHVVRLDVKRVGTAHFWRSAARARPDIIHAIAQPTYKSLVFVRLLQRVHRQARTVISALRPERYLAEGRFGAVQRRLMRLIRPDLVLVQYPEAEALFGRLGCRVAQLPNGVDLERFKPAPDGRKRLLRQRYGLEPGLPVALHVGHLAAARNLMALAELPKAGIQVLVAGSVYMGTDLNLIRQLEGAGFRILRGYQPCVEELYMLADCYVFPVRPGDSLSMPLSVLEAMSCNLPVITTRFRGLQTAFREGNGLRFVDHTDSLLAHVQAVLASSERPATREMVRAFSWQSVVGQLLAYYRELVDR